MHRWPKITLKIFAILLALIFLLYVGVAVYVNQNKESLIVAVNKSLNDNVNGTVKIGSIEPSLLQGFPGVSVNLKNVTVRDSLWHLHRHTLLNAKEMEVSLNVLALLTGTVRINRMTVKGADIYLFTNNTGYSNTSVFKTGEQQKTKDKGGSLSAEINRFAFVNVNFTLDNRAGKKMFRFVVPRLTANVNHRGSGWKAKADADILVRDLAFNTQKGSFLKDKRLKGGFLLTYSAKTGVIEAEKKNVEIGGDTYVLGGHFSTSKKPVEFVITLDSDKLIWKRAASLLAPNISKKLNMFDLTAPFAVNAVIAGNMGPGSQPSIDVSCKVKNNVLSSPGGIMDNCSFSGIYSNHYINGKGNTDENSIIRLFQMTGTYEGIPVEMDTLYINNLVKPQAGGTFKSRFNLQKLNAVFGEELLKFNSGSADINVRYKASIADFELSKPVFTGTIAIRGADADYIPRKLNFKNSDVLLHFTSNDLQLKDIRVQSGSSILRINGTVRNFMNLYYTAPEKMLFNCNITSPRVNLGEFLGLLAARQRVVRIKKKRGRNDFIEQLNNVLDRSRIGMNLRVDKLIFNKFTASDARANLTMSEGGIHIEDIQVRHAGGFLRLSGTVNQSASLNRFAINARVSNVNIRQFFYAFDNFGMQTLTHENLKGYLFSKTNVSGAISDKGKIVPRSFRGSVIFDLKRGELIKFPPLQGVAKFAFPFRNLDSITFSNLNGKFDLLGDKIRINPMKISSSVLNMNVAGTYALNRGTNIALDVPLRNPGKDEKITDKKEIEERRMKGIVLHILATDEEDGKLKFKWNKNHD